MSTLDSRLTLALPDDWTPEQALAVYELLSGLAETVWNRYETPLIELLSPEFNQDDASQPELFDFDDQLPF
jgi:hypothetical protein